MDKQPQVDPVVLTLPLVALPETVTINGVHFVRMSSINRRYWHRSNSANLLKFDAELVHAKQHDVAALIAA